MVFVRPVETSDLTAIADLSAGAADGLSTLAPKKKYLKERIEDAERALDPRLRKPGGESYLFVLADARSGRLMGLSGMVSKTGGFDPFYTYHIKRERFTAPDFQVDHEIPVFHFTANNSGPAEIGNLFLSLPFRGKGFGKLLSLHRFLFMAAFPKRFDRQVIAELRGVADERGRSPFWEAVGRKFFKSDFKTADFLTSTGHREIIANLMPRHPLYLPLLPKAAQAVVGRVHPSTEPALSLLKAQGFTFNDEVDIFDAGPTLSAKLQEIKAVRASVAAEVKGWLTDGESAFPKALLSNERLAFRACEAPLRIDAEKGVRISTETGKILQVEPGQKIRYYL